jgi:hypothetical protein
MKYKFDLLFENIMSEISQTEFDTFDELVECIKNLYPETFDKLLNNEKIWYNTSDGKFKLDKIKADYLNIMYSEDEEYNKHQKPIRPDEVPADDTPYKLSPEEEYEAFKEVSRTWTH